MAPATLENSAVSCYLNSTLQCLARMDKFIDILLPHEKNGRIAVLRELLINLATTDGLYSNTEVQEKFHLLSSDEQEDPHEFIVKLIDAIECDLKTSLMSSYTVNTEIITSSGSFTDKTFPLTVNVSFPCSIDESLCDSLWSQHDFIKIKSLPQDFFLLHLNRVSYDVTTHNLVKACDEIILSEELDMALFEDPPEKLVSLWQTNAETVKELTKRRHHILGDKAIRNLSMAIDELDTSILPSPEQLKESIKYIIEPFITETIEIDQRLSKFSSAFWSKVLALKSSDIYKLRSFILHSGSANEGHYIAAVKEGDEWWVISDENVSGPYTLETLFKNAENNYLVTLAFYSK